MRKYFCSRFHFLKLKLCLTNDLQFYIYMAYMHKKVRKAIQIQRKETHLKFSIHFHLIFDDI